MPPMPLTVKRRAARPQRRAESGHDDCDRRGAWGVSTEQTDAGTPSESGALDAVDHIMSVQGRDGRKGRGPQTVDIIVDSGAAEVLVHRSLQLPTRCVPRQARRMAASTARSAGTLRTAAGDTDLPGRRRHQIARLGRQAYEQRPQDCNRRGGCVHPTQGNQVPQAGKRLFEGEEEGSRREGGAMDESDKEGFQEARQATPAVTQGHPPRQSTTDTC